MVRRWLHCRGLCAERGDAALLLHERRRGAAGSGGVDQLAAAFQNRDQGRQPGRAWSKTLAPGLTVCVESPRAHPVANAEQREGGQQALGGGRYTASPRLLGSGGSGVVYAGARRADGEPLALKALCRRTVDGSAKLCKQLRRECKIALQLAHPGVAALHDVLFEPLFGPKKDGAVTG